MEKRGLWLENFRLATIMYFSPLNLLNYFKMVLSFCYGKLKILKTVCYMH